MAMYMFSRKTTGRLAPPLMVTSALRAEPVYSVVVVSPSYIRPQVKMG